MKIYLLAAVLLVALDMDGQSIVTANLAAVKKRTTTDCGPAFTYDAQAIFRGTNNILWPGTNVHSITFTNPDVKLYAEGIFGHTVCTNGSSLLFTNNDLTEGYRFVLLRGTNSSVETNKLIGIGITGFTNAP